MSESPYVFISYASADRERVLPLVDRLEAAGVATWIDREGIHGGANYAQEITEAIKGAAVLAIFCSADSLASRNVRQELALGWRFEKPYLPLLLEPVTVPDEVAYWLEAAQWVEILDRAESDWLGSVSPALARHDIILRPADAVATAPTRDRPLLVGREREQAWLREQLDRMLAGQGGTVLVGGEAGIGKTTLVEDLGTQAEEAGCLVLWGHAYDLSVTPPYGPWLEIFRQYRSRGETSLPAVPIFVGDAEELAKVGSQETLFAAVAEFFSAVAAQRSLMLVVDDLHWVDQASLDFFRFLARRVSSYGILLLATYRSDELHRRHPLYDLLPLLVREAGAERLDVGRLAEAGHVAFIGARYSLRAADQARLAAYLAVHGEGNPLYAGELLRTLEQDGVLWQVDGSWQLGDLTNLRVPPLLRQVIDGRLKHLEPETRGLLQVGSVIGQEVPVDIWQRVSGADDQALITALEQGREAQLLEEEPGGEVWRFNHALIREALYADLISLRRRALHRQVAEQSIQTASPDPDMVAHHFQQASDPRALEWLRDAGRRAERAYAWPTAIERYETVLSKLTEQGAPASERAVLLYHIAHLERYLDAAKTVALMGEARQLALEAGEPALAARCQYAAGMVRQWLGDVAESVAAMEQAVADYEALPKPDQARLWSMLGIDADAFAGTLVVILASSLGRFDDAVSLGTRQITDVPFPSLRVGQGESQYADGLLGLANAAAFRGHPHEARRTLEKARAIYQTIEHHTMLWVACQCEFEWVQLPYFTDDLEGRRRLLAIGNEAASRSRSATVELPLRRHAVGHLALAGDWDAAWETATGLMGTPWVSHSYAARWLVPLAVWRGDTNHAWRIIGQILPAGPRTEPGTAYFPTALPLQLLAAAMAIDANDLPTAHAWLEAHDRWLARSGAVLGQADGALGWAQYHHAGGDATLARQYAEQALGHASDPRQPLALIAVHRFLGLLDTEAAEFVEAEEQLQESLRLADACQAPFERALTLLEIAELRIAQPRPQEAKALLDEVQAICEPLGAAPTLSRVAALEQQLGAGAGDA